MGDVISLPKLVKHIGSTHNYDGVPVALDFDFVSNLTIIRGNLYDVGIVADLFVSLLDKVDYIQIFDNSYNISDIIKYIKHASSVVCVFDNSVSFVKDSLVKFLNDCRRFNQYIILANSDYKCGVQLPSACFRKLTLESAEGGVIYSLRR